MNSLLPSILLLIAISIPNIHCDENADGILLIGGFIWKPYMVSRDIEYFNPSNGVSKLLKHYKLNATGRSITSAPLSNQEVIVMGGADQDGNPFPTTFIINIKTQNITLGPEMNIPRSNAASALFREEVWICGGFDHPKYTTINSLNSCEVLRENKWVMAADMQHARADAVLVAFGDNLFTIGGTGWEWKEVLEIEFYNTRTSQWEETKYKPFHMYGGRIDSAAVAIQSHIYICGGLDSMVKPPEPPVSLQSCRKIWKTGSVKRVKYMNIPRRDFAMAEIGGKIYAFGGINSGYDPIDSIEEYDPDMDEWKIVGKMTRPKHGLSAVAVSKPYDGASTMCLMPFAFYLVIQLIFANLS